MLFLKISVKLQSVRYCMPPAYLFSLHICYRSEPVNKIDIGISLLVPCISIPFYKTLTDRLST